MVFPDYRSKNTKGYVILPCFTVEIDENNECNMTCNKFLGWIFEFFFAPFWSGKITIYEESNQ